MTQKIKRPSPPLPPKPDWLSALDDTVAAMGGVRVEPEPQPEKPQEPVKRARAKRGKKNV